MSEENKVSFRAAQYQCFPIDSISIIQFVFLSIPISISIILKRAYQYQYFINYSKNSLINFNINTSYQYLLMILLRLPISYQLVIVININVDINYQNRLLSISMQYQLSEHFLINFNINFNIAIFAHQYFLINALSSSGARCVKCILKMVVKLCVCIRPFHISILNYYCEYARRTYSTESFNLIKTIFKRNFEMRTSIL